MEKVEFVRAVPVWPDGMEKVMNLTVGFRAIIHGPVCGDTLLRITASSIYRFYINGIFAGCGPARGPHGYYRIDEWNISDRLIKKENILAVEVAGYNVNSYYLLNQPSFLQAEILTDGIVAGATAEDHNCFEAKICHERLQKVQRYSFQRPFIEMYSLYEGYGKWRIDPEICFEKIELARQDIKLYLARNVSYSEYEIRYPAYRISSGRAEYAGRQGAYWKDRSLTEIGPTLLGFREQELEAHLSDELQDLVFYPISKSLAAFKPDMADRYSGNDYRTYDFGVDLTGFIGCKVSCVKNTRLLFIFDEVLRDEDIDFKRMECVNAVSFLMEPGVYEVETMEPYTFRFLKLSVLEGECDVEGIYIREYANPDIKNAGFNCSNDGLNKIFNAGAETFRQNALDIFMDCASRERAGWLCDSFFASRVEYDLTGRSSIESNFFENFLLPEVFEHLPTGMLPMCYPADHYDGNFIPNWGLWFIVQLEEYLERSGDLLMVQALKGKVYGLLDYFIPFRNEYGLLERLEKWVFIEWSMANQFVQDVNYPTNMLYAAALEAAGRMYGESGLVDDSKRLRDIIREKAYNGKFFIDNAVRKNGELKATENTTEVCQYFAFYFNIATPETHSELWETLFRKFGPVRSGNNEFPAVHTANAFVGNYLRLELLSRYEHQRELLNEVEDYFTYMAERTGTLWEHTGDTASCNHSFASHIVHCLYRDALGISKIDRNNRQIVIRFGNTDLEYCEGHMPVEDKIMYFKWRKKNSCIEYQIKLPEGYELKIENSSRMVCAEENSNRK